MGRLSFALHCLIYKPHPQLLIIRCCLSIVGSGSRCTYQHINFRNVPSMPNRMRRPHVDTSEHRWPLWRWFHVASKIFQHKHLKVRQSEHLVVLHINGNKGQTYGLFCSCLCGMILREWKLSSTVASSSPTKWYCHSGRLTNHIDFECKVICCRIYEWAQQILVLLRILTWIINPFKSFCFLEQFF